MKARTAACPSCGGPVEFRVSTSLVTVCEFCNTAVARGDKTVEEHGKVSDLVHTDSRLQRGLRGHVDGKSFEVLGRVQYSHPAGGIWDEWYLAFPGGRWGWLSESQGKIHLSYEKRLKKSSPLPRFEDLEVGRTFDIRDTRLKVVETGVAKTLSAEGEIPWSFMPEQAHPFADLHGDNGVFATFEYDEDGARCFLGREVSVDELNLEGEGWQTVDTPTRVGALALNCPQCGGSISLRVPDKTERVFCDNCHSVLDASEGKLEYFKTLEVQKVHPVLPLGGEGELFGDKYTIIGFMARYAMYAGQRYPWSEYLLHNPEQGFRWLIRNDRHWMFAEPVSTGTVGSIGNKITFRDQTFRIYDRGTAYVRYVLGEFYWRVEVGEQAQTADYIAPPHMLSFERSETGESSEENATLATYVSVEEMEAAFGVESLSRPWGVAPAQPAPVLDWRLFCLWPVFVLVLVATYFALSTSSNSTGSDPILLALALLGVSAFPIGALVYKHNFEVQRWRDSDYSPYSTE